MGPKFFRKFRKWMRKYVRRGIALWALGFAIPAYADPVTLMYMAASYLYSIGYIGTAIALVAVTTYASTTESRRKAASQRRGFVNDYNAALKDQGYIQLTANPDIRDIYGEKTVGGYLVAAFASNKTSLNSQSATYTRTDGYKHLVIALGRGPIQGIDDILINGVSIGALDGNGDTTTGTYYRTVKLTKEVTIPPAGYIDISPAATRVVSGVMPFGTNGQQDNAVQEVTATLSLSNTRITAAVGAVITYEYGLPAPAVRVTKYLGTDTQTADAALIAASGGQWTSNHRGRGWAYVIVRLDLEFEDFQAGTPDLTFTVRGKNVYDPRLDTTNGGSGPHRYNIPSTWTYSRNTALITAMHLMSDIGFSVDPATDINWSSVIIAANDCDVMETPYYRLVDNSLVAGTPQVRYAVDALITAEGIEQTQDNLVAAMAGSAVYGAQWSIYAGVWRTPIATLNDSDLDGEISIVRSGISIDELFNSINGTFLKKGESRPTEVVPYSNDTYVAADGKNLWTDITFPYSNDQWRVEQLCRIMTEQQRYGLLIDYPSKLNKWPLAVGERVYVNSAEYNYVNKPFMIENWSNGVTSPVTLRLREDSPSNYDLIDEVRAINRYLPDLPDPRVVPAITGLAAVSGSTYSKTTIDGYVIPQAYVSWDLPTDGYSQNSGWVEISTWMPGSTIKQVYQVPATDTSLIVLGPKTGQLINIGAKLWNGLAYSTEVFTAVMFSGVTAAFENVTSLTTVVTGRYINITWAAAAGVTYKRTELRVGSDWASGTIIFDGAGRQYSWPYNVSGTYTVWAKHFDRSGNESATAASSTFTYTAVNDGPFVMLTSGNASYIGGILKKNSGATNWDTQGYSQQGFPNGAYTSFRAMQTNLAFMAGLNSDPAADANYTGLDYAWYLRNDGLAETRYAGSNLINHGAYTTADIFGIQYDGVNVRWTKNGVVIRTLLVAADQLLFFDSSLYNVGAQLTDIAFGPMVGAATRTGIAYIYKRDTSTPTTPSVDATFTFATGVTTGLNNGWTQTVPAGTDPIYISAAAPSAATPTATIVPANWSAAQIIGTGATGTGPAGPPGADGNDGAPGADGAAGTNSALVTLYQRTATNSAPSVPATTLTYTFATGGLTGTLGSWVREVPTSGGPYLWTISAAAISINPTDDILTGNWSGVGLFATDGSAASAYWVRGSVPAIQKSIAGVYTPATVTFTAMKATGTTDPTVYAGRFVIATSPDGSTYTDQYTSSSNESSKVYTIPAGIKTMRVRLYLAGGTTVLLDEETLTVVSDGAAGTSAKLVTLTASHQVFQVSAAGVGSPSTITFTAAGQNLTGNPSWTTTPSVTLGGAANATTRTLDFANMGANTSVEVMVTWDGQTDKLRPQKVFDGAAGTTGQRVGTLEVYQWAASAPTSYPSGTSTYTWANGTYTAPSIPGLWTLLPGAAVTGQTLWAISVNVSDNLTSATSVATWNSSVVYAVGAAGTNGSTGSPGSNGTRTAILEMYQWAASTPSAWPSGSSTYTWATGTFTAPGTPGLWTLTPGAPNAGQTLYVVRQVFSDSLLTATSSVTWTATSSYPSGAAGSNGSNGQRIGVLEVYQWSTATPTTFPAGTSTYTWATGTFTAPSSPNSWLLNPGTPTAGQKLWGISVAVSDTLTTATSTANWNSTTPYVIGTAGVDGSTGPSGISGLTVVAPNLSHSLPAGSDGVVSSYLGSGTTVQVYEGSTLLTAAASLVNGSFNLGTPTVNPTASISVGGTAYAGNTATIGQHNSASAAQDVILITWPVNIQRANGASVTAAITQTLTKSKAGVVGTSGIDGITWSATNLSHNWPASADGTVASYTGSGMEVKVYEGSTALTYRTALATSSFTIGTPVLSPAGTLIVGGVTGNGTTLATIAQHSAANAATDLFLITWPITVQRANNNTATFTLTQSITKARQGLGGINAVLDQYSVNFPAYSDGVITSYAGGAATMSITIGGADDSANWTYTQFKSDPSIGISSSGSPAGRKCTITSIPSTMDTGWVEIRADRSGYPQQALKMSFGKNKSATPSTGPANPMPLAYAETFASGLINDINSMVGALQFRNDGTIWRTDTTGLAWEYLSNWYIPTTTGIGSSYQIIFTTPTLWNSSTRQSTTNNILNGATAWSTLNVTRQLQFAVDTGLNHYSPSAHGNYMIRQLSNSLQVGSAEIIIDLTMEAN